MSELHSETVATDANQGGANKGAQPRGREPRGRKPRGRKPGGRKPGGHEPGERKLARGEAALSLGPARRRQAALAADRPHADPAIWISAHPDDESWPTHAPWGRGAARPSALGPALAVKDNIDVAGLPTTAACPAFALYRRNRRRRCGGCSTPGRC